jgi:hypothetical protein
MTHPGPRPAVGPLVSMCEREYLPHDFPPYQTVYDHCAKWETGDTTEMVHELLRDRISVASGRSIAAAPVRDCETVPQRSLVTPLRAMRPHRREQVQHHVADLRGLRNDEVAATALTPPSARRAAARRKR